MRQDFIEDDEEIERGPSKSQLKREQLELQALGREMTKLGDDQLKRAFTSPKTCSRKSSNSAACAPSEPSAVSCS